MEFVYILITILLAIVVSDVLSKIFKSIPSIFFHILIGVLISYLPFFREFELTLANEYISLGFALGIGGKLLCDDEYGKRLSETVKSVPLSALLVETDAPFVLPDTGELPCSKKKRRKLCNSSLI